MLGHRLYRLPEYIKCRSVFVVCWMERKPDNAKNREREKKKQMIVYECFESCKLL